MRPGKAARSRKVLSPQGSTIEEGVEPGRIGRATVPMHKAGKNKVVSLTSSRHPPVSWQ